MTDHLPRELTISRDSDDAERAGPEQVTLHVGWTQKSLGKLMCLCWTQKSFGKCTCCGWTQKSLGILHTTTGRTSGGTPERHRLFGDCRLDPQVVREVPLFRLDPNVVGAPL